MEHMIVFLRFIQHIDIVIYLNYNRCDISSIYIYIVSCLTSVTVARSRARFGARRKLKKNTIWCTKKTRKKHDLVHEENHKKHDSVHEENRETKRNFLVLHLKHV